MFRKKKLIVKIGGGLGNQMHEYALGRYIADRTGRELFLDLTDFTVSNLRKFQLDRFSGAGATPRWGRLNEWVFFILWAINRKLSEKLFTVLVGLLGMKWLHVKDPMTFQPEFDDVSLSDWKGTIFLSGCYGHVPQMPSRVELRRIFAPVAELSQPNRRYALEMKSCDSVSVHIRRSDYLWQSNGVPVLDTAYHWKAIALMREKVKRPVWFIFSDDIAWCRDEFRELDNAVFVVGNDAEPWEDIRLMALCRHHIIANSTFSWWGAYLGEEGGFTTYPKPWFRGRGQGDSGAVLPCTAVAPDWIAVSSFGNEAQ